MIVCHYCEKETEVEPVGPGGQWTCKKCRFLSYKHPKPHKPGKGRQHYVRATPPVDGK